MTHLDTPLPEQDRPVATMAGHWILAKLGKRVLRPGGRALTERLLDSSGIPGSDIVELAPGLGLTARAIDAREPRSYRGVDADPAAVQTVNRALGRTDAVVEATADKTGLAAASADLVFGEAMLTMQSDRVKKTIADEAFRLLRPGRSVRHPRTGTGPRRHRR